MKLEPIDPQEFTDFVAYKERKRTPWERFLDKIKPRSAAMRTTVLVIFVVFLAYLCLFGFSGKHSISQKFNNMHAF